MLKNTIVIWFLIYALSVSAQTLLKRTDGDSPFIVEQIATGLIIPWGMAFISDQQLIVTERVGTVKIPDLGKQILIPLSGAPAVFDNGQGGLLLYSGAAFANWQGNLFAGVLKLTHLNRMVLDPKGNPVKEERLLAEQNKRIRAITADLAGLIYLSTDSGKILRLKPIK